MKLNLVPKYVNEGKVTRAAWVGTVLLAAASILIAVFLVSKSSADLKTAREKALSIKPQADDALAESQYADKVIAKAHQVILNINLADAMKKHSTVYPDLFDEVQRYVPSFYRLTSISAAPTGADTCQVTMTGLLETQQQYADLMLALNRIPNVQGVTRQGYTYDEKYVPSITDTDQAARPRLRSDAPIPDDPLERLDYFIGQGSVSGYENAGGFGSGPGGERGAMPGSHTVTVTVQLPRKIQTPNPRASLGSSGGGNQGGLGTNPGPATPGGNRPNVGTGGGPNTGAAEDR